MFKRKGKKNKGTTPTSPQTERDPLPEPDRKLKRKKFPGPAEAKAALRVAMSKQAFSSVVAHAQSSLEREICGVLVGEAYQDERGVFVQVEAIVQGKAQEGATHVTFTQETWTDIYQKLDQEHPKKSIVGWYHSHPGFGVTFSEMDLFIQKNFFSSDTQIALVTDPLKSLKAIIYNGPNGIQYLDRFWIDGHEQTLQCLNEPAPVETSASLSHEKSEPQNRAIEERLSQTLQAIDDLNNRVSNYLYFFIFIIGLGFIGLVGFWGYTQIFERRSPPELLQYYPTPIELEGETVMIGVGVYKWPLPPKLVAQFAKEEKKIYEEQIKHLQLLEMEIIERAKQNGLTVEDLLNDEEPAPEQPQEKPTNE